MKRPGKRVPRVAHIPMMPATRNRIALAMHMAAEAMVLAPSMETATEAARLLAIMTAAVDYVAGAEDHRFYLIFKDLQRLAKMEANRPKVQKKVEGKPPVLKPGRRATPEQQQAQARQAALDRLTKTGSPKDAVALLMMGG